MIVVEYKGIELDYCTDCHGVWFDSGELGLLLKSLGLESERPLFSFMDRTGPGHGEKSHKCPICQRKMRKVTLGEQPAIIVDACHRGDGLWFDGGELAGLLNQLAPEPQAESKPQQQVTSFLREVFQDTEAAPQR